MPLSNNHKLFKEVPPICARLLLNTVLSLDHEVNVWIGCRVFWFWAYPLPGLKLCSLERFASLLGKSACWAAFIIPRLTPQKLSYKLKDRRKTGSFRTGREAGKIGNSRSIALPIGNIDNVSIMEFTNYRADINCFVKIYWWSIKSSEWAFSSIYQTLQW